MNKKILIFGGTGAIGFSIAKKMNEEGYSPVIISRNKEDLASKAENIGCEYETCDILDSNQIENVSKKYNDEVVGLAYCVGSINLKPLRMSKNDDFIDSFKINTLGAINVIKSNLPSLTKNNGSILLFSTVAVQQGFTNHSIVSSSKGAIEGLTLSLAAEFAPKIRVNCIAPSLTESKMSQKMVSNETIKKAIENMHPIPKIGQGEDFGDLSSFLLSEKNSWITGQIFHIDGGRSTLRIKA
ncbi:MAG: SDR family NAD(P)-dependent oxidoreductase [Alphaproteobacteria bacterium]